MAPLVSVVIPTRLRPALLQRCLDALAAQTLDAAMWELIVVDDGHSDATRLQAQTFEDAARRRTALYLRPNGTRGPAAARNCGWRAARGPVVAFTDDDTVPDPDWLHQGFQAMATGVAAVRGRVVVPPQFPLTDHGRMTQGLQDAEFVTANCFVRRDALAEVGGFDERFERAWREDSDLHFKLLRRHGDVPAAPLAVVQHPVREAPWGVSLKQQANTMFDALLFKKHPQLYRAMVGRTHAPPIYYAIVFGTTAAMAAGLAGEGAWAIACEMLVLGLVARLAGRRLRDTSRAPRHVAEMVVTSFAIPFLSLYWRLAGAVRFKVPFF
jgi:glycosyltransferase involved in cell wall biosynthesis